MSDQESGVVMEAAAPAQHDETSSPQPSQSEPLVPVAALQAERQARQQMQDELKALKQNMEFIARQQQPQAPQEEGLDDNDVATVGQIKQLLQADRATLKELQFARRHADYEEVIRNHLPRVLEQQPGLRQTLQNTQDYELAYYLAKSSDSYREAQAVAKEIPIHPNAEKIIANANKSGSLSSAGHGSPISQAQRWSTMSDAEFRKYAARHSG